MKQMIENKIYGNDNMQKRFDALENALYAGGQYLGDIIGPQLEKLAKSERDLDFLRRCAQGSYLMRFPEIRSYTVVRHYFVPDKGNICIIAINKNSQCGFFIDANGWAQYGKFNESRYRQFLCESSEFVGRAIGDIADQSGTPPIEVFARIYLYL